MTDKKSSKRIKESAADKITKIVCLIICIVFLILFVSPIIYMVVSSVHTKSGWSLDGYVLLLKNPFVLSGFKNSVIISTVGTILSLILEILVAYALSQPRLKTQNYLVNLFTISIYFGASVLPLFLLFKSMNLINTIWAVILPGCFSVYYMLILRTSFLNMGQEMQEAASIDGCNTFTYLFRVAIPIINPTMFTTAFLHFCIYWGNFMYAKTFLVSEDKYPLSLVLNEILINNQGNDLLSTNVNAASIDAVTMAEFGLCVISTLPIICLYILLKSKIKDVDINDGIII